MIQANTPQRSLQMDSRSGKTKSIKKEQIIKFMTSLKGIVLILIVLNLLTLYFVLNPLFLRQTSENQKILDEIEELTDVNTFETPIFSRIKDVETIKQSSAINAEVYKDAANGDYVVGFSDKMIIYRRQDDKIVYEGDSPGLILQRQQQDVINKVVAKAKELQLVEAGYSQVPQLSVITDQELVKASNPQFYANAKNGDIIAFFTDKNVVLVYNESSDTVVNFGTFTTQINSN